MNNLPKVKIGVVGVSRDCFPAELTIRRRKALVEAYAAKYDATDIYECPVTIIESEIDMKNALADIKAAGCNALCVYLGNFGPEISETMLIQQFDGPAMLCAAAEEDYESVTTSGRGDAYCGVLNASYNMALRNIKAYIPEYPVGDAEDCATMINEFVPIARAVAALKDLKIISFGPRPLNFLACNAPIKQLYNLGVEIEENSELDLFESFNAHADDPRIPDVIKDMEAELGDGNNKPTILPKLAQYELTLLDWVEAHKGSKSYVAIAGKCWPAFQTQFGCVPCYVNSRLTGRGIPVSCEVDIYGVLSEFIGQAVSDEVIRGFEEKAAELAFYGCEILVKRVAYHPEAQLSAIESCINEGVQGIIITPYNDERICSALNHAASRNIPIITVNSDAENINRISYVGSDYYNSGRAAAALMQLMTFDQVNLGVILGDSHILCHSQRHSGFLYHLNNDKRFNVVCLEENFDDDLKSYDIVSQMLKEHPEINGLYFTAAGVYGGCKAVQEFGYGRDIRIITHDDVPTTVDMLDKGIITATICQQPRWQGSRSLELMFSYLTNPEKADLKKYYYAELNIKIRETT